ncbi:MAG TPA: RagB/SusD family nutrient uptake outer membrane protein [Puia sp.]|nr:RagB/SusD family nutrient uptake outer membrane protein [Puia sp.]
MNNRKNYILYAGVGLLFLSSCSKNFINKSPYSSTTLAVALSSVTQLQTALNGAYAQMRSVSLYGRDIPVTGDLQADNTFVEVDNSGRYLNQFKYTFTNADGVVGDIWNAAYIGIQECNQIIDANVTGADAIKAQAYALRGLLYFKLVNTYARPYTDNPNGMGVPLILHYQPSLLPKRDSISKVYAQIVSDLKIAFQNGPAYSNSGLISKYAAEALLARTYLYMGDNTDAKTAAVDVINNSGFTLAPNAGAYAAFWANPARKSDKVEVLYEVDADAVNNNGTDGIDAMYMGGYTDIYASQDLVSLYSATDVRNAVLVPGTTKSGAPATLVGKYPNYTSTDKDNPKVIRLAEVYLIAAEASLPGNEADARKYLNELMAVRDPAFPGYASTGAQLLTDIITERRKELAFEGDRYYDLNRLKMDIVRPAINPGSINGPLTIPYSDYRRVYPIPLNEVQANANIASEQNPGYQ